MATGVCLGESDGLTFWLAEEKDYDDIMGISDNIYGGSDYLPHRYHDWMKEPDRVVVLARKEGKLVALESGLVVDNGSTVVVEGLRVCPSERGRGVAGVIQRFADGYIHKLYPSIRVKRQTRGDNPSTDKLAKFTVLAKRAGLALVGEADSFPAFISHLKKKIHSSAGTGSAPGVSVPQMVPLGEDDQQQLKKVLLDPELSSRVQLPGGAIIQDWQPLQPIEANLEILRRRNLTWLADNQEKPTFLSFYTPPYPIPHKGGSLRLNIDMFGTDAMLARVALVSHLEKVLAKGELRGRVRVCVYMHLPLYKEFRGFCECDTGVTWSGDYQGNHWEQLLLERAM